MFVLGTVSLPNPTLGDTWSMNLNTTVNKTVDGTVKTYKGDRPTYYTYTFGFVNIKKATKDALIVFLKANAGVEITITADQSIFDCSAKTRTAATALVMTGFITTTSPVIRTDRDNCSYSTTLEFIQSAADTIKPYVEETTQP